jgi:putative hydrolase of the HAD superfamily
MTPRLVCIDAGFTLIRPRQTMAERFRDVLRSEGHTAADADIQRAWEAADEWFWAEYHRPDNVTWTSDARIEETWRSYHRLMLRHLGVGDEAHRLIDLILRSQFAPDAWELYEDTLDALDRLRRPDPGAPPGTAPAGRAPVVAVVSDWSSSLSAVIAGVGLADRVDHVLASAAEGVAKPDPEFFRRAARRAGVDPWAAVMIGDSYRADVLGARSAGMDAVLLDRTGTAGPVDPATPVARSLAEAVEVALGADRAVP